MKYRRVGVHKFHKNYKIPHNKIGYFPISLYMIVVSRLTWAFIPYFRVVNLGTRAAEHQGCNWDMQIIDGCSLELCVATLQWCHLALRHRNKLNSITWLFRDGSIRKYQFTFYGIGLYIYNLSSKTSFAFLSRIALLGSWTSACLHVRRR